MKRRISWTRIRRLRRPLAFLALWLLFIVMAVIYSPLPKWRLASSDIEGQQMLHAFDLVAEPTLLVFHRAGGLKPGDRAYVKRVAQDVGEHIAYGEWSDETYTLALVATAQHQGVSELRAIVQEPPRGLATYVTGADVLAYDAACAWQKRRWRVLVGSAIVVFLVTLFRKFGISRAAVVGVSAGGGGTMASVLASLFASPLVVALGTALAAGLAGTWAVRLLSPRRPDDRSSTMTSTVEERPDLAPTRVSIDPLDASTISRVTPFQHALVQAGEGTLLQAFIVIAGLAGFLFDLETGLALFLSVVVAIAFSLSGTPALIALLARPRHPRPVAEAKGRRTARLGLAMALAAGVLWLTPSAHPVDAVPAAAASGVGYDVLQGSDVLGRALPFHLLIRVPRAGRSNAGLAALRDLSANLAARPELAVVEGEKALQTWATSDVTSPSPPDPTRLLEGLRDDVADLVKGLEAQTRALATTVDTLERIQASPTSPTPVPTSQPIATPLAEARARLDDVRDRLVEANAMLVRVPTEFPEIAPRMHDVPALVALPDVLAGITADLADISADMSTDISNSHSEPAAPEPRSELEEGELAPVQAELNISLAALENLATRVADLQEALTAAEAQWAGAALGDPAPIAPSPYLVSHDLVRLVLVPAGDPYATATLESGSTFLQNAQDTLHNGPLSDSVLSLHGAPVVADTRRNRHLHNTWLPGIILAALTVMLFAWGTLSRASVALRLAIGAVLSSLAGVGLASVLGPVHAGTLAVAGVTVVAVVGGRMAAGWTSTLETLTLALPPLCLGLTGIPALVTMAIITSCGLLVGHWLVAPTFGRHRGLTDRLLTN